MRQVFAPTLTFAWLALGHPLLLSCRGSGKPASDAPQSESARANLEPGVAARQSDPVGAPSSGAAPAPLAPRAPEVPQAPNAGPGAAVSASPEAGRPCGNLGCRIFDAPRDAFARVLEGSPRILGVGEAHALSGTERIESATRRFTRDLLPLLAGHASDIVVELLLPNAKCVRETSKARQEQKVVTEHQARTDQNDYVALANQARALGIRPHALEPTCEDLARIAGARPDAVTASLDVVTRLARETLSRLYSSAMHENGTRTIVAYGGAIHNDVTPRPGREQWSFGPALQTLTGGHYVELDLIVPEFVADSPAWKSLPWISAFDPNAHPESTTLFSPAPDSFVLVFPRTSVSAPP